MIAYHLLLARKHGAAAGVALLVSFSDTRALTELYTELTNHPGLAEFQKEYAEIAFVSDGVVLHHHELPNPATIERQRQQAALVVARNLAAARTLAEQAVDAAKARLSELNGALKELTPEQKRLLAADQAEREATAQAIAEKADAEAKRLADEAAARELSDEAAAREAAKAAGADTEAFQEADETHAALQEASDTTPPAAQ